jgi:hypothetical protein
MVNSPQTWRYNFEATFYFPTFVTFLYVHAVLLIRDVYSRSGSENFSSRVPDIGSRILHKKEGCKSKSTLSLLSANSGASGRKSQ